MKDFPIEVYDTYLKKDVREKFDYEFITEELWKYLKDRYDVDHEIKRFYTKQNSKYMFSTMTSVESRFKTVPVMFVKGEDLLQGKVTAVDIKIC